MRTPTTKTSACFKNNVGRKGKEEREGERGGRLRDSGEGGRDGGNREREVKEGGIGVMLS